MLVSIVLFTGRIAIVGYINYTQVITEIGLETTINEILESKTFVGVEDMPDTLIDAFVSTEDKRFYKKN